MNQTVINPATLAVLGDVPEYGAEDMGRAVAAARRAAGAWSAVPGAERAALLRDAADRIRAKAQALAELSTREGGPAGCESLDEVRAAAAIVDFFARSPVVANPSRGQGVAAGSAVISGVSAALIPFEMPLPVMAEALGRCLARGMSVVCKPPVQNPLSCLEMARAFEMLPAGTLQLVTGGAAVGRSLAAQADEISFTGSRAAAAELEAAAGGKRLELEVGTIAAHIVCRDADLDLAVPAIAWTRLRKGGQGCISSGHVYVERSLAAEFIDRMHPCMGFLDVDDPRKCATDLGPLISIDAARRVEDQVGRTLRAGARLILGGRRFRPSGLPGHFFQPTLLTDVAPGGVPMREQILGPVVTVTPVSGLAEALGLWREFDSGPPLGGSSVSIYAGDAAAAAGEVEGMDAGVFRINDPAAPDWGPFSGLVHRGIRHALGMGRLDAGAAGRVEMARAIERKPWWFPYIDRARAG